MTSVQTAVGWGQLEAAALMTDLCVVRRPGPPGTPDPETGLETPTWSTPDPVYSGPWKRQTRSLVPTSPDVAGEAVETTRLEGHWPIPDAVGADGFPLFRTGDVVFWATRVGGAVTASTPVRAWRITAVMDKTHRTAVRLPIEEHTWQ
jgi:hypothetical protein